MRFSKLQALAAAASWAMTAAAASILEPRGVEQVKELGKKLSANAKIYWPGSPEFEKATTRWSALAAPKVNVVVVPATEKDVSVTVSFANNISVPFLAFNGVHGSITTLGKMQGGIEIWMNQLSSVKVSADGKTATIGGGTMSKKVTDDLWAAGKQTVTGTCECVSLMGPALGGGHGWLQGHHGLVSDQFLSMNVVLADGSLKTIDSKSDLWWGMKGAGHNFGIVTSVTTKVYDIQHSDWAIETLIFKGDKVEAVYKAANEYLLKNGTQPVDVINWSYWLNNPDVDADKPVIIFYIIQEGVKSVDPVYTKPFHDIGPAVIQPASGTYKDLAAWTGIALDSPPCQNVGNANPRFPIYLDTYNVASQKKIYDIFAAATKQGSDFANSLFMFEGYSEQGVQAIPDQASAFAFRGDNLLAAPLIIYQPAGAELDKKAKALGDQLRSVLQQGSGRTELHTYVNYAYGSETKQQWYGSAKWRQDKLSALKKKYDPKGRFSFYAPVA
ncbi:FAD binding domain-containingprotein [Purpureocillium lavendulum]|uniref:FAD binding domain-containingprotein n=1 Tax=Purpureocillium lavendulum TaxID=1247861 RepID=A0AB34G605_9HYPO|nr:FAD binding domain-containingprotein [Purpureocillium lavendulum]